VEHKKDTTDLYDQPRPWFAMMEALRLNHNTVDDIA
jgi:hypothetical protein